MGYDIVTIGHHHLNTSDVVTLATQLSKAYGISVEYGYNHDFDFYPMRKRVVFTSFEYIPLGNILYGNKKPTYVLIDKRYEEKNIRQLLNDDFTGVDWKDTKGEKDDYWREYLFDTFCLYDLCPIGHHHEAPGEDISTLYIYEEAAELSLCSEPSWSGLYLNFAKDDDGWRDFESLNRFRSSLKEYYRRIGVDKIYYFADQGPTELIMEKERRPWVELEEWITSKAYYDLCPPEERSWKVSSKLQDIPKLLLEPVSGYNASMHDVFVDDFSDLK